MSTVEIIAHRGAPETAVENTREAIKSALESGASIIETDLRITADNHLVLAHDPDFSRLGGPPSRIRNMSRSDIEALRIPDGRGGFTRPLFMDEALAEFPGTKFNVDLKDRGRGILRAWNELLSETGSRGRCLTASFSDATLRRYRRCNPGAPVSAGRLRVLGIVLGTLIGVPQRPRSGEGFLQIPEKTRLLRIVNPKRLAKWRRWGWKVHLWTVDTESDMKRLISWGVDGIITNRPSLLREILFGSS